MINKRRFSKISLLQILRKYQVCYVVSCQMHGVFLPAGVALEIMNLRGDWG